mgnify:CR=1 FL=1
MSRVKRGSVARKHRRKILKFNKGFRGSHSKLFRTANQQYMKSFQYSYTGRSKRKREFRKLWIRRINAASKTHNLCYSVLVSKLRSSKILLNRKILAQISVFDKKSFGALLDSKI